MTFAPASRIPREYTPSCQTPSLQAIDHAIMDAARSGDVARRDALMTLRCTVVLADLCAALADAVTAEGAHP